MSEELDYLSAGNRLKALLEPLKSQGLREVFIATDVDNAKQQSQVAPAVHIMYRGDRLDENTQSGRVTKSTQTWLLILIHRSQPNQQTAGVLLAKIISAVAGQTHGDTTFRRVTAPVAPGYSGGFVYLPLAFEITVKVKGERQ
ncbi:conserved hypothetical protein [Tolumonas auensis DSM 9187]|uniref:Uncharacterized protein n=1 Tax=Tolumonas auensis (strain DSM 9187 / NBRC 110442 / TA 4) TaxID=595494 RepID=C4LBE0_TOLAT|nr:hypothetical protein [Tolumonas auensis]ACQ92375.1 conserved hypothetical protein [Tolumonas auensis DSM 9187]